MKKRYKIIAISGIVTVFSLLLLQSKLADILEYKLNELIIQDKDRTYDYKIGSTIINFFKGDILLTDISITPRTKFIDSLKTIGESPSTIFNIHLESFEIEGLSSMSFLLYNKLDINTIHFQSAEIEIFKSDSTVSKPEMVNHNLSSQKKLFSDIISKNIKSCYIQEFSFNDASSKLYLVGEESKLVLTSKHSDFIIHGLTTNDSIFNSAEVFQYDSSSVDLRNIKWMGLDDYEIELGLLQTSSSNSRLKFKNLHLRPVDDKFEFMQKKELETDWFNCQIGSLVIEDLDLGLYQATNSIHASKVLFDSLSLEVYRDKRKKDKAKSHKALPSSIIRSIEQSINIPLVLFKDSKIDYYEWEIDALKPIHINMEEVFLEITNFSTNQDSLKSNDTLRLLGNTRFMNNGMLDIEGNFYVNNEEDQFDLKGKLSNMDLPALNPMLGESAFINFEDGHLNFIDFEMIANEKECIGKIDFSYSRLTKLDVLRKKSKMEERKIKGKIARRKRGFLSFLLSELVPENFGPDSENYQSGRIEFQRLKHKSAINYIVSSLKSGIINSFLDHHPLVRRRIERENKKHKKTLH